MPKKKEQKGDGKRDEAKKTPVDKTGSDDEEKRLYRSQIRYLDEELERYRQKSDELESQNKKLKAQYSSLEIDKKDIVEFLKHSLLEKENAVDELTERMETQLQAADKERDAMQLHQNQVKEELQGQIEELIKKNTMLAARLDSLEEFQKQREQLMSNMESLETQLAKQKDEHKTDIHNLEMKALLEKRRLKEEMESYMAPIAKEVQHLVDQKLTETTRMALQENTALKLQLSQLSEEAQILMKKNLALQDRKNQLSLSVDILEKMLKEKSRQSCNSKKLTEKCQQQAEKCQQLQKELKDNREENKGILAEVEALRQEQTSLSDQQSRSRAEEHRLEAELEEERRKRSRMKSIMQDATVILRHVLMETPIEQESVTQKLLQKVLVILNGPSTSEDEQLNKQMTSDPAAARTVKLARPGNPPARKHKDILSRTGAGSCSTATPMHRKPSSQKTSSINPSDSAACSLTPKHTKHS